MDKGSRRQLQVRARPRVPRGLGSLLVAVALASALPGPAQAQSLQLITPYPGVAVEAGKTINFNIEVRTPGRQRVDLALLQVPEGWGAALRGGGFVLQSVFGAPENPPQVQLEVKVPAGVPKGDYQLAVRATSAGASDTLTFTVKVAEAIGGAVTLTPEFPSLRGEATSTFRFNLTLTNNTPEAATFNLAGEGPRGWRVEAHPSSQAQAASVKVEGGASETIELEADPPDNIAADSYPIKVRAVSGSSTAEASVTAEVSGSSKLTLSTPSGRLNAEAVAGKTSDLTVVVSNEGNTALKAVSLSGSPPADWKVDFEPKVVQEVPAGKKRQAKVKITPSGKAVAGDYVLTLSASSAGGSDDAEIRVTVKTSRLWGLVGLLLIAAAGFGLYRVFQKYGRR